MKLLLTMLLLLPVTYAENNTDVIKPTIDGLNELIYSYLDHVTEDEIITNFVFRDNVSSRENLHIYFNKRLELSRIGKRAYIVYCEDEAGNVASKNFTIEIYDHELPNIVGPDTYNFTVYSAKSAKEIMKDYYAYDDYDGYLLIEIEVDNYTANMHEIGIYQITLKSSDFSNNVAYKDVIISIEKEDPNIYYLESTSISVSSEKYVTPMEMVKLLISNYQMESCSYYEATYVDTNYTAFYDIVGTYQTTLIILLDDERSSKIEIELLINVLPYEQIKKDNEKPLSFFDKIVIFFKRIINKIKSLFR